MMNHLIVSVSNPHHCHAWEYLLQQIYPNLRVHVVDEDWEGKAGNGLGTLYAFHKTQKKHNLIADMEQGASVTIYHTAGSGKRLYPLVATENNNKGAVQLPALTDDRPLTLLEAVIRQTISLAHPGRLTVFWGDQLFFPTVRPRAPQTAIEIFSKELPFPNHSLWQERHLNRYGLIAHNARKEVLLFDKIEEANFLELIDNKIIDPKGSFATSLGCFSLEINLLQQLLHLFRDEILEKKGSADTDPHFWMPLILDRETYLQLTGSSMESHYQKMRNGISLSQPIFDTINIGGDSPWWDFGSTVSYFNSCKALTSPEGQSLRDFFELDPTPSPYLDIDKSSILINCSIGRGYIRNSVLMNVVADEIDVEESILIGARAPKIFSHKSLGYKIRDQEPINLTDGSVRSDWFNPQTKEWVILETHQQSCGKEDWEKLIGNNPYRWSEVESINTRPPL